MSRYTSLLLPALLALLGACSDGIGPGTSETGSYALVSIDGRSLPTPFFSVEVLSGSISLEEGGTYRAESTVQGRDALGQLVTETEAELGTYTRSGTALRFVSTAGDEMTATYGGRTITVEERSIVIVYRRRS